ncbi:MAG: hypothetical protein Q8O55_08860 [Dehalococcoidales bacterium]|nr:hypothetical protein [Dehalococcoidales bacterium]
MKPERASEIVESYINGNLSWVKENIRTKKDLIAVIQVIREICPNQLGAFLKIMAN